MGKVYCNTLTVLKLKGAAWRITIQNLYRDRGGWSGWACRAQGGTVLGAGRVAGAQARGLGARAGQGCALGALGLFLAWFDSVFFLSQIFGHCS